MMGDGCECSQTCMWYSSARIRCPTYSSILLYIRVVSDATIITSSFFEGSHGRDASLYSLYRVGWVYFCLFRSCSLL